MNNSITKAENVLPGKAHLIAKVDQSGGATIHSDSNVPASS